LAAGAVTLILLAPLALQLLHLLLADRIWIAYVLFAAHVAAGPPAEVASPVRSAHPGARGRTQTAAVPGALAVPGWCDPGMSDQAEE
jgi:hypothetical protein